MDAQRWIRTAKNLAALAVSFVLLWHWALELPYVVGVVLLVGGSTLAQLAIAAAERVIRREPPASRLSD